MRPSEKCCEPVQTLDDDMPTMKRTIQRREGEAVLSRDGIEASFSPDNVEEPRQFADHRADTRGPSDSGHHQDCERRAGRGLAGPSTPARVADHERVGLRERRAESFL